MATSFWPVAWLVWWGVDECPAVAADWVAVGAGLVDDREVGRGDVGFLRGGGGDGLGGRDEVVSGLVADRGEWQEQAPGISLFAISDGERRAVDRGGDAAVALGAFPDRPVEGLAFADLGRPGGVDAGQ